MKNMLRRDGGHEARARLALTRRDAMKPEDEPFLSAFLDGELDPDQRAAVESALISSPILAEHLRRLASVRELVANLPRHPARRDLSKAVLERIRQRSERSVLRRRRAVVGTRRVLAAAASIVLAVVLGLP